MDVADDAEWIKHFGEAPETEAISGDEYVREIRLEPQAGELLHLTWDVTTEDLRIRWYVAGVCIVDVLRERILQLFPHARQGQTGVLASYERDGSCDAAVFVQVWPGFRLFDSPGGPVTRVNGLKLP